MGRWTFATICERIPTRRASTLPSNARLARRIYRDAGEYTEAKAPFIQRILAQALGKSR